MSLPGIPVLGGSLDGPVELRVPPWNLCGIFEVFTISGGSLGASVVLIASRSGPRLSARIGKTRSDYFSSEHGQS